ncbi:MAG: hypothetical protein RSE41_07335 [Clostridia bacterium]
MENKTDFFTAPASTKYHSNFDGGLLVHTIKMTEIALHIYDLYIKDHPDSKLTRESVIKAGLFHDLCKINNYKKSEKWLKNSDNKWVSYLGYEYIDTFPYGHGEKSILFINNFMPLNKDEMLAIRHHMGNFEGFQYGSVGKMALDAAFAESPLVIIIHTADSLASFAFEDRIDYAKNAKN